MAARRKVSRHFWRAAARGPMPHASQTLSASFSHTPRSHPLTLHTTELLRTASPYLRGMLDVCSAELSYEPVGLLFGITEPSGTIADGAFESMRDELLARLRAAMAEDGGVDAVALELHGAGVAESYEDVEGALAKAVRSVVGPDVPIVGAFDLHGNISAECAAVFDFMTVTWYYPHTDCYERGQEAVRMLPRLLGLGSPGSSGEGDRCGGAVGTKSIETMGAATVEKMRTFTHLERVPTLLPLCMMCTQEGFPAASLHDLCQDLERAHAAAGVLDCSVFHGFPYADIAIAGTTVIVTTDADAAASRALAGEVAREVAGWIWAHKERFRSDACSADAAIATARRRATELNLRGWPSRGVIPALAALSSKLIRLIGTLKVLSKVLNLIATTAVLV